MSLISPDVEINGAAAQLASFTETCASIKMPNGAYAQGEDCSFTVFLNLMGKWVPVKLSGQIVQDHGETIDVMFMAPTQNWNRLIHIMCRRECLM